MEILPGIRVIEKLESYGLLPAGYRTLWSGETIPEGWKLADDQRILDTSSICECCNGTGRVGPIN